jgi:ureidoacrylate peracid hydrolase
MPISIDPQATALIVIDMQNAFCHPEGGLARSGANNEPQRSVVPSVKRLVQVCHDAGVPVLWSIQEHWPEDRTRKRHRIPSHLDKRGLAICARGSWDVELHADLKGECRPEYPVFLKHRMSCFFDTNLHTKLRMLGTELLIIAGVSTNVCVESTIRDAYFRDYDILVVEDCVACSFPDLHRATLKNVEIYFGQVTNLNEVEKLLAEARGAGGPAAS